ncbi:DNA cytosine methyltransferase [Paenarthrobacter sp. NPDC089714]|uniref:DNA cytosine methyltransferase n=1 Tax=Paenarthrobacter sp. NPDC089714 TaxID=3364377 RepID=UPI003801E469
MRAGELCAGYGGLALAIEEVFGATTAWFSEFDPAPSKILAYRWPDVPNHGDMTKIDWSAIEQVDLISGGTPCQDLSTAGRRAGMNEGTRSNLWVTMREAIAVQKPRFVAWENVRGAFSADASSSLEQCPGCVGDTSDGRTFLRALGRVLGDLSDLGYDCQWRGVRASDVGAPHGRFRVFVLAANRDYFGEYRAGQWPQQDRGRQLADRGSSVANANDTRSQGQHHPEGAAPSERHGHSSEGVDWGRYAGAVRRWEAMRGAAPSPVELSPAGKPRLSAHFAEWMMGLPPGWITAVPGIGWGDHLKACGNGVVPQQAAAALRHMLGAFQAQWRLAA